MLSFTSITYPLQLFALIITLCWPSLAQANSEIEEKILAMTTQRLGSRFNISSIKIAVLTPRKVLNQICNQPHLSYGNELINISNFETIIAKCKERTHFIRISTEVNGFFWTAAKSIPAGHTLSWDDLIKKCGMLNNLESDIVSRPEDILGKVSTKTISVGQTITLSRLKNKIIIASGSEINLTIVGLGFTISTRAKAVRSAALGDTLLIRTHTGKLLTAVATSSGSATATLNI